MVKRDPVPEHPNILFIFCDQMRSDCMSCVGHPVVETPNIDEIGRKGVVFGSAYASVPSCIAAGTPSPSGETSIGSSIASENGPMNCPVSRITA